MNINFIINITETKSKVMNHEIAKISKKHSVLHSEKNLFIEQQGN
jgi:hypothetical protein